MERKRLRGGTEERRKGGEMGRGVREGRGEREISREGARKRK